MSDHWVVTQAANGECQYNEEYISGMETNAPAGTPMEVSPNPGANPNPIPNPNPSPNQVRVHVADGGVAGRGDGSVIDEAGWAELRQRASRRQLLLLQAQPELD